MQSLFLGLPVEIRVEINRYLVGRYSEQEVTVNSREYNLNRKSILSGGDFTHQFHPAILGVNKQIRKEALDVLIHEGGLIHVTTCLWTYHMLSDSGLSVIAKGAPARLFQYAAMSFELDGILSTEELKRRSYSYRLSPSQEPIHFLTSTSSLLVLCAMMTRETYDLRSSTLKIQMGERSQRGPRVGKGYLGPFLPCLNRVRGFEMVKIHGLRADPSLVGTMEAKMCGSRRNAVETMFAVSVLLYRATTALDEGKYRLAIKYYKIGLNILRGSHFDSKESSKVLKDDRYDGLPAGLARYNAEIQLHSLIATCYLQLGNSRLARIYVERIYGPLYSLDDRANRQKFPLANLKGRPEAYAELLGVAAQISWSHGKWREAFCELHYAKELDSSNSEIQQQRIEYEKYNAKKKTEVQNRQSKGDQFFHTGDFRRAHSKYHAALTMAQTCLDREQDLCHSLMSSLAVVSLKLELYHVACYWAGEIFEADREYWRYDDGAKKTRYRNRRFYTAYWAKGVALEKLGKIDEAIDNLERAEMCDPTCDDTRRRLAALMENGYIEPLTGTTSIAKLLEW
ncbi:hypothetical protein G7Y79_00047g082880 [Physcia stellaris]|nr:hypothetical protein G7Y79_00047g082880 [Physcia stellaris]